MTTVSTVPSPSSIRNVLIIDGQYANIGAREMFGAKLDYKQLRKDLETLLGAEFTECWYFDHERINARSPYQNQNPFISSLKLAPPMGPQFQIKMYAMKSYKCHCPNCGLNFTQNVQKGVDNGIATKMLSLAYEDMADRIVLLAGICFSSKSNAYRVIATGDGDFYDTLDLVRNIRHKDLWVVGYQPSLSPDLQQLASKVVWLEDLIPKTISASLNESNNIKFQATTDARTEPQSARAPSPPSEITTVYVGNIGHDINRDLLRATFEHCGPILDIRMNDRGFCFMDFASLESAELATAMDGVLVAQRRIVVNVQRRGRARSPRYGGPSPPVQSNSLNSSSIRVVPDLPPPTAQENKIPVIIRGKKRPASAISVSPTSSSSSSTEGTPRKKFKGSYTVFVGGLNVDIEYSTICEIFDKCGTIVDIAVHPRRRDTICFITFATDESANAACKLHGTAFQDRQLIVERHRKKKKNRRSNSEANLPRNHDQPTEASKVTSTSPKTSLLSAASNRRVQIDKLIGQTPKAILPRSKTEAEVITVEPDVIDLCLSSDEDA